MFADVTSANVVGYTTNLSTNGMNYYSAPFKNVSGEAIALQSIQLDDTVLDGEANIQRLNEKGGTAKLYNWYTAATAAQKKDDQGVAIVPPAGATGCWVYQWDNGKTGKSKKDYFKLPDGEEAVLQPGDAVQIWTKSKDVAVTASGAVSEEDVEMPSIAGMNYIGNPYPANLPIQSIQLEDTVLDGEANIQRLNEKGGTAKLYNWYTAETAAQKKDDQGVAIVPPAGATGCWVYQWDNGKTGKSKKDYFKLPDGDEGVLVPGQGVQLWTKNKDVAISIKCPYDLKKND